jgi:hypothetical protein
MNPVRLAAILLVACAAALVPVGLQRPAPLRPYDGAKPRPGLVRAVQEWAPFAERISYDVYMPPGIPDPAPDHAQVEFDQDGVTCLADVTHFSDDRPVVDEPACPSVGLQGRAEPPNWDGMQPWLIAAAAMGALGLLVLVVFRERDPLGERQ